MTTMESCKIASWRAGAAEAVVDALTQHTRSVLPKSVRVDDIEILCEGVHTAQAYGDDETLKDYLFLFAPEDPHRKNYPA